MGIALIALLSTVACGKTDGRSIAARGEPAPSSAASDRAFLAAGPILAVSNLARQ
jgi:hypothetical protein